MQGFANKNVEIKNGTFTDVRKMEAFILQRSIFNGDFKQAQHFSLTNFTRRNKHFLTIDHISFLIHCLIIIFLK